MHEIIKKHKKAFSLSKTDLGRTEVIKHSIDTGDTMPVRQQPRRMSTKQKQECIAIFWTVSPHSLGSCHFR